MLPSSEVQGREYKVRQVEEETVRVSRLDYTRSVSSPNPLERFQYSIMFTTEDIVAVRQILVGAGWALLMGSKRLTFNNIG